MASPAFIVGCGYLGSRVATAWRDSGRTVFALTRSRPEPLRAMGIEPIIGDVMKPETLAVLPHASTVLYAVGMDRTSGYSMREVYLQGLENVLKTLPNCERFISISSTSVYGQTQGELVDEASATQPIEESGSVVLAAEELLKRYVPHATILRFAGIYGPNRLLRRNPILNAQPLVGDAEKWLNLIHVEDGVRAVLAAEAAAAQGSTFNIADDTPVWRRDFYTRLAQQLNATPALFEPYPPGHVAKPEANRRVNNAKARAELGFAPQFPSYIEGLQHAVNASVQEN